MENTSALNVDKTKVKAKTMKVISSTNFVNPTDRLIDGQVDGLNNRRTNQPTKPYGDPCIYRISLVIMYDISATHRLAPSWLCWYSCVHTDLIKVL